MAHGELPNKYTKRRTFEGERLTEEITDRARGQDTGTNSKLETLDDRSEPDFLGLLRDRGTCPAASLQTLGAHPLKRFLHFQPEAVDPAVFVVDPFEPTEVGTHLCRAGCPGLVLPSQTLADVKLTLELPTRLRAGSAGILRADHGVAGTSRGR